MPDRGWRTQSRPALGATTVYASMLAIRGAVPKVVYRFAGCGRLTRVDERLVFLPRGFMPARALAMPANVVVERADQTFTGHVAPDRDGVALMFTVTNVQAEVPIDPLEHSVGKDPIVTVPDPTGRATEIQLRAPVIEHSARGSSSSRCPDTSRVSTKTAIPRRPPSLTKCDDRERPEVYRSSVRPAAMRRMSSVEMPFACM